ncbi:hypothetical protein QYE76_015820 [Lolium multiflorum]|uniref:Arabidopsis retrotransposon Orf1 C-terminal domain-containing protein n=1 Tax=Lolium multiflorum TaxID=4521 RepID=A0AAD8X6R5_LOLMU|nr:hypothetical protein QYE76_015820 [Lolium multiflorum]
MAAMAEGRSSSTRRTMTDDEIARLGVLVSEVDRPVQPPLPRYATGIMPPGLTEEEALRRALEDSAPQPVQPPPPPPPYNPWAAPPPPPAWAAPPPPPACDTSKTSRQIESTEIPNENTVTPVNSPESVEHSSDDPDEDYVELDDDFIDKCNATTGANNDKNDVSDKEEIEDEPEKHAKNKKYTKEDFIAKKHGTSKKIENRPKALMELYREVTNDDDRTIQRGKIRNIQLPAIRYFTYYLATSILGRENTSNISSYHLAFLVAALTGSTPYHLGALIARRLSNKGPIYGGIVASRIVAYLGLSVDPSDEKLIPIKLDIAAMKGHQFVTTNSNLENIVYRMLFIDGDEREIPLPQADLFSVRRRPWSRSKEEVDEQLRILGFHQQHDSEDAEPSYGYTVTYPGASSSLYQGQDPPSSYYGGATSWAPWD